MINSGEQLEAMVAEAEQSVLSVRVERDADKRLVSATVTLFDGRVGVDRGKNGGMSGDLTLREWQLARSLCADRNRQMGVSNTQGKVSSNWCDWNATRFPRFAERSADRPLATITTSRSGGLSDGKPGAAMLIEDNKTRAIGERHQVMLVRSARFWDHDEVNEIDDPYWEFECVEPTTAERQAPFVQMVQARADKLNAVAAAELASARARFISDWANGWRPAGCESLTQEEAMLRFFRHR